MKERPAESRRANPFKL